MKLVVVAYTLPYQSAHFFNELVGYQTAARAMGLTHHLIGSSTIDSRLAEVLSAERSLDPLPLTPGVDAEHMVDRLMAFADAPRKLESLWASLEAQNLTDNDIILFPVGSPILISGIGSWLARRPAKRRPGVFFRILETGHESRTAILFRIACANLRTQSGQERVFLLADNSHLAAVVSRICARRTFVTPVPKYLGEADASGCSKEPAEPTVYVHLNRRSRPLVKELANIIRCIKTAVPEVRFIIKPTKTLPIEAQEVLNLQIASLAEILPEEQQADDFLANFSKCTAVLLPYEPQAYAIMTSGVFVEAASFGKPVVVPGGTWMARQIIEGCGAGTIFEEPDAQTVVAALLEALRSSERLGAIARSLAPQVRNRNSCREYVEKILLLNQRKPDMEPRYEIGEEINFSDAFDSRCFMGDGWGETETWGVWTIGRTAELILHLSTEIKGRLVLKAFVQPFLGPTHRQLVIHISADGQEIAQWSFGIDALGANEPEWREATIPPYRRDNRRSLLTLLFTIDAPSSPLAEGISNDSRALGLGLRKLSLRPVS
jgi:glycosyltransferase involved in cell wall biosynthesis